MPLGLIVPHASLDVRGPLLAFLELRPGEFSPLLEPIKELCEILFRIVVGDAPSFTAALHAVICNFVSVIMLLKRSYILLYVQIKLRYGFLINICNLIG